MNLSIRNELPGTVTEVTRGEAMATVGIRLTDGPDVTAAVTRDAVDALGLAAGRAVRALAKSTEVSLATGPVTGLSIRNQLPGAVASVAVGEAMAQVAVDLDCAVRLTAAVTRAAADDLALTPGTRVTALVKATELAVATT